MEQPPETCQRGQIGACLKKARCTRCFPLHNGSSASFCYVSIFLHKITNCFSFDKLSLICSAISAPFESDTIVGTNFPPTDTYSTFGNHICHLQDALYNPGSELQQQRTPIVKYSSVYCSCIGRSQRYAEQHVYLSIKNNLSTCVGALQWKTDKRLQITGHDKMC